MGWCRSMRYYVDHDLFRLDFYFDATNRLGVDFSWCNGSYCQEPRMAR